MDRVEVVSYCFECRRPLVEIDNRDHRLYGCMTCNIWWSLTGSGAIKLSVEDLAALHAPRKRDMRNELSSLKHLHRQRREPPPVGFIHQRQAAW